MGRLIDSCVPIYRFVQTPTTDVMMRLNEEGKELKSDVGNLEKKLHYLETTYKNSKEGFEKLLQRVGEAS
jgi:prefoldin subunit 1